MAHHPLLIKEALPNLPQEKLVPPSSPIDMPCTAESVERNWERCDVVRAKGYSHDEFVASAQGQHPVSHSAVDGNISFHQSCQQPSNQQYTPLPVEYHT